MAPSFPVLETIRKIRRKTDPRKTVFDTIVKRASDNISQERIPDPGTSGEDHEIEERTEATPGARGSRDVSAVEPFPEEAGYEEKMTSWGGIRIETEVCPVCLRDCIAPLPVYEGQSICQECMEELELEDSKDFSE
jgi:hypothetical protein